MSSQQKRLHSSVDSSPTVPPLVGQLFPMALPSELEFPVSPRFFAYKPEPVHEPPINLPGAGLPACFSVVQSFNIEKKPHFPSDPTRPLFDRLRHFTNARLVVFSLLERSMINGESCLSVFYALLDFALSFLYCLKVLRRRHLVSHPHYKSYHLTQFSRSFGVPILDRLSVEYPAKKAAYFAQDRSVLRMILDTYSVEEIAKDPVLSQNLLYWLSCFEDFTQWYGGKVLFEESSPENMLDHALYESEVQNISEKLSNSARFFDPRLHYALENCLNISSSVERIKTFFSPSYNTGPFLEMFQDLSDFGILVRSILPSISPGLRKEIEVIRQDYYLAVDFLQDTIKEFFPLIEQGSSFMLSGSQYGFICSRWLQLSPPEALLVDSNSSMSFYRRTLYLYYYSLYSLLLHTFPHYRCFLMVRNYDLDFLTFSWFRWEDYAFFFDKKVPKTFLRDFSDANTATFFFIQLRKHAIYCLRLISFFKIRQCSILRYIKLNPDLVHDALAAGESELTKEKVLSNFNETQIVNFKTTIFKPEHFLHQWCNPQMQDSKVLKFIVPKEESTTFFSKPFEPLNTHYNTLEFNGKLDSIITNCNIGNPSFSVRDSLRIKNEIIKNFNSDIFANTHGNYPDYFDVQSGLFKFDFNPYENVDYDISLIRPTETISVGTITEYVNVISRFQLKQEMPSIDHIPVGFYKLPKDNTSTGSLPSSFDDLSVSRPSLESLNTNFVSNNTNQALKSYEQSAMLTSALNSAHPMSSGSLSSGFSGNITHGWNSPISHEISASHSPIRQPHSSPQATHVPFFVDASNRSASTNLASHRSSITSVMTEFPGAPLGAPLGPSSGPSLGPPLGAAIDQRNLDQRSFDQVNSDQRNLDQRYYMFDNQQDIDLHILGIEIQPDLEFDLGISPTDGDNNENNMGPADGSDQFEGTSGM